AELSDYQAKQSEAERRASASEGKVNEAFDRGKRFYDAGRVQDALKEGSAIPGQLEDAGDLQDQLNRLRDGYGKLQAAKNEADSEQSQRKFSLSQEMKD